MQDLTFLEFVADREIGPPLSRKGKGCSTYPCPSCGSDRAFQTLPDVPQYKHRLHCHRCGFRGDALDLLKELHPEDSYSDRKERLQVLRAKYDQASSVALSPRGEESQEASEVDPAAIGGAFADWQEAYQKTCSGLGCGKSRRDAATCTCGRLCLA